MRQNVLDGIQKIIDIVRKDQNKDGSWNYPFETGISTDCYMIILLRTLEINDENLIKQLTDRIVQKQEENGAWKLFYDEGEGNITATIEAYYALLYSGYLNKTDKIIVKAKKFILQNGGIENAHMFTKFMLALTGQFKWPSFFPIPIEFLLLPTTFPINIFSFSEYGRANLIPVILLADRKFSIRTNKSPDLSDIYHARDDGEFFRNRDEWRIFLNVIKNNLKSIIGLQNDLHKLSTEHARNYMLKRIEPDGTFLSYFSSTFLMIFGLLALGYTKSHPLILNAVKGLQSMKTTINGLPHMQYTTANVWNTSLLSYAIQEAGVSPIDAMVKRANLYLQKKQHYKYGDWVIHNPYGFPGGWGFSDVNTIHPDVDDTTTSLRSIARGILMYRQSWDRGISWLLSMQNRDGGWPAFEKNTDSRLLELIPIEKANFILTDPSSADVTGRTLEFLGNYTNLSKHHPAIKSAVEWLKDDQRKDGSWYGRWGICFIYGTWGALTGLSAVGVLPTQHTVSKAVDWLVSIQNEDGGWGESCKSDKKDRFVSMESTLTHTAWAVDALIATSEQPTKVIKDGIRFLIKNLNRNDWSTEYPKGQGMAGDFYIHYHSYRYIFPLLALAHFRNKYIDVKS